MTHDVLDSSGKKIGTISVASDNFTTIAFGTMFFGGLTAFIFYQLAMELSKWQTFAEPYRTIFGAYYWIGTKPANTVIYGGRAIWDVLTTGSSWYEVTRFPNLNTLIAVLAIAAYAAILLTLTWLACRLMRKVTKLRRWLALFIVPAVFCLLWYWVSGTFAWLMVSKSVEVKTSGDSSAQALTDPKWHSFYELMCTDKDTETRRRAIEYEAETLAVLAEHGKTYPFKTIKQKCDEIKIHGAPI